MLKQRVESSLLPDRPIHLAAPPVFGCLLPAADGDGAHGGARAATHAVRHRPSRMCDADAVLDNTFVKHFGETMIAGAYTDAVAPKTSAESDAGARLRVAWADNARCGGAGAASGR